MPVAYISFGSNMGDKEQSLYEAIEHLIEHPSIELIGVSSIYDTDPVGYEDQDVFMNLIAEIKTTLEAEELLTVCQSVEQQLKRVRIIRWGPRTMDLDIIFYGEEVIQTETLLVPHPRMHERGFVLVPLNEIAPTAKHAALGKTVDELLAEVGGEGVRLLKRLNIDKFNA